MKRIEMEDFCFLTGNRRSHPGDNPERIQRLHRPHHRPQVEHDHGLRQDHGHGQGPHRRVRHAQDIAGKQRDHFLFNG